MELSRYVRRLSVQAKEASRYLAVAGTARKNRVLKAMASELIRARKTVLAANRRDVRAARAKGLSAALLDRLTLTPARYEAMIASLRQIVRLKDPVGEVIDKKTRPNGLVITKLRVPIGVIGIIYESRPNVTVDCAGLCLKSGNAVILKGGSDALHSNRALYRALARACRAQKLPPGVVSLIESTRREAVDLLLQQSDMIDLIMPRGGEGLIREVVKRSRIPVIKHYKGVCHLYVDDSADQAMAERLIINAKCQRPGVCNAIEKILINERIARTFVPRIVRSLRAHGVALRGCPRTVRLAPDVARAKEADWSAEYLDLILTIKIVRTVAEAVDHITRYGSMHSDGIVTKTSAHAAYFTGHLDSAAVYVNASTRFTDGGEFGMGAEIGISTDKIHARGPMGLAELCSYKYVVHGSGQVRA